MKQDREAELSTMVYKLKVQMQEVLEAMAEELRGIGVGKYVEMTGDRRGIVSAVEAKHCWVVLSGDVLATKVRYCEIMEGQVYDEGYDGV